MRTIKAIDTRYNGYLFRSRLEARWAVFFDRASLRYTYEEQGYEMPSGWYLPDFYLPTLQTFVEVKPAHEAKGYPGSAPKDLDQRLGAELAERSGRDFVMVYGDPIDALGAGEYLEDLRGVWSPHGGEPFLNFIIDQHHSRVWATHARQARFEHGATP